MADIDAVLERIVTDTEFRSQLAADPAAALSGYELSASDVELLASSLDDGPNVQHGVEQRTSKSAVLGLLASLSSGAGSADTADAGRAGSVPRFDLQNAWPSKYGGLHDDGAEIDNLAAPTDEAEGVRGNYKAGDITLKRGAASPGRGRPIFVTDLTDPAQTPGKDSAGFDDLAAPAEADEVAPTGITYADMALESGDAPPGVSAEDSAGVEALASPAGDDPTAKVEVSNLKAGDTSVEAGDTPVPPGARWRTGEDVNYGKVEIGNLKAGASEAHAIGLRHEHTRPEAPDENEDFLTIEDA